MQSKFGNSGKRGEVLGGGGRLLALWLGIIAVLLIVKYAEISDALRDVSLSELGAYSMALVGVWMIMTPFDLWNQRRAKRISEDEYRRRRGKAKRRSWRGLLVIVAVCVAMAAFGVGVR